MNCDSFTEPTVIAKSNVILDVKPWSDETDLAEMEKCVRSIEMDGLLWGACEYLLKTILSFAFLLIQAILWHLSSLLHLFSAKLVPVGYGIKKLQISSVIEDDKVDIL